MGPYVKKPNYLPFERLAEKVGLIGLDIGARGGVSSDLQSIGKSVDFIGLEPDAEECERLNALPQPEDCRSARYIPWAAAEKECVFNLNLYRQRGCSSKYEADSSLGALFSRDDYYILDDTVSVKARPLDDILDEYQVQSPAFLKIDIQGMEVDVFQGAKKTIAESLVGIRTEVSFFPIYKDQPLFSEVDQFLRPYGFVPMRWLEFHEWRRSTKIKHPALAEGSMPYSQGQIIHGDVLYLLHPEWLSDETEADIQRLIRLGLVSICYGHLDHAKVAFMRPRIRALIEGYIGTDPIEMLAGLSSEIAATSRRSRALSSLCRKIKQVLGQFE